MQSKQAALILLALLAFSAIAALAMAQPAMQTVEWCKTFGYGEACSVIQADGGNFLVAAQSSPTYRYTGHLGFTYDNLQGKLLRISPDGIVIQTINLPLLPETMIQTGNGSLVIAGEVQTDFGTAETDVSIFPTYQSFASLAMINAGVVGWNRTYYLPGQPLPNPAATVSLGTSNGASVQFLLETSDGGYLLGGSYCLTQQLFRDNIVTPWLIRTDASGNTVWIKTYEGNVTSNSYEGKRAYGYVQSAVETIDGGFLLIGQIKDQGLTKIDSSGAIVWSGDIILEDQSYDRYSSVTKTPDGGYLLAGYSVTYNDTGSYNTGCIIKIDNGFTTIWRKYYSDYWLNPLSQKYVTDSSYYFSSRYWLLKTDLNGDINWVGSFNGTISSFIPIEDGYLVVGSAKSNPSSDLDTMKVWVAKVKDPTVSPSPSPTLTPSPSIPEFPYTYVVVLTALFTSLGGVCIKKRKLAGAQNKTVYC